jgi:hypothetical protein
MYGGKTSIIVLFSIIAIAFFTFEYSKSRGKELVNENQDPQYLIEAREKIVGVWYEVDNPNNIIELNNVGLMFYRNENEPEERCSYKIINTTPICGKEVLVDETKKTMYFIETDNDNIDACYSLKIFQNDDNKTEMALWALDMGANGITNYIKK